MPTIFLMSAAVYRFVLIINSMLNIKQYASNCQDFSVFLIMKLIIKVVTGEVLRFACCSEA